jgi:hypothetical protein
MALPAAIVREFELSLTSQERFRNFSGQQLLLFKGLELQIIERSVVMVRQLPIP